MSGKHERIHEEMDECERFEIERPQAEEAAKTVAQSAQSTRGLDLRTIAEVVNMSEGTEVTFYATIQTLRSVSPTLDVLHFRDRTGSIHGMLSRTALPMTKSLRLSPETFVQVYGTLQKPLPRVSKFGLEVAIYSILPLHEIYDEPEYSLAEMTARILDLRLPSNKSLFRIRAMVLRNFRQVLEDREFIEIHTPKLQPAATEISAETFEVDYYGRPASLAHNSQLANQLAIESGFARVYEAGPVFGAKVSKTQGTLAESINVEIGMTFGRSYHDLIQIVDDMLKSVFAAKQAIPELRVVRERWPSKDIVWLEETPIITVKEALHMLQIDGQNIAKEHSALRDDVRLGALVKDKYMTDYFILDELSTNKRPISVELAEGRHWTDLFSIFLRGQSICTGGQWVPSKTELWDMMKQTQATEDDNGNCPSGLDLSTPPHGGASICLEHFLEVLLELDGVTCASLFHSDSG
ncbi:uncharacterized protein F5Z01DRAFT_468873 [Emericellopsis atlantica]|uniref:Aminoacyl-transfer RNA synthetases class-II family profile domain-containing protein n=1 Tax=Emericellopsis atlantica TaxID=2614577 RepID=A0A9P7ZDY1_9HYPO|nr:uncharacterized protein F5Z01DRAFT_468873 [Emericellopsis atlantica]KAG9249693.1 hypothetical protein F5Z01DRAFT_468873 [Emericellopsis atlantica]